MSGNCEKCLKGIIKSRPGVKCGTCTSVFHVKCADITDEVLKDLKAGSTTWLCPDCRSTSNTSIIDDTVPVNTNDILGDITLPNLADVVTILKGIQSQLDSLKNSVNFLCHSLDDMKLTVSELSKDAQRSNQRLELLEQKAEAQAEQINTMEALLDRPTQELNKNNIILCGIPPNYEDIPSIIMEIGNLVGVTITKEDLISTKQMSHIKQTTSLLKNAFILTLKTVELKHMLLNSFRKKKTIFFHELATDYSTALQNQRIFLLHHLTKFQSRLYNAAKIVKNKRNFKYLWCKNNIIYLREKDDSRIYQIDSFNQIDQFDKFHHTSDSSSIRTPKSPLAVATVAQETV